MLIQSILNILNMWLNNFNNPFLKKVSDIKALVLYNDLLKSDRDKLTQANKIPFYKPDYKKIDFKRAEVDSCQVWRSINEKDEQLITL